MLRFRAPLARPLRRTEYKRAMRDMLLVASFAMPYGSIVGVSGPIFAGLMLEFGIEKAAIGLVLSAAYLTQLLQIFTFRLTGTVNPRALVLCAGTLEVLFTISVITVPLWAPRQWTFAAVVVLVALAWAAANVHVPTFNSWFASIIPSDVRSRYISRRTFVQYSVGIISSLAVGRFVDMVPGMKGFSLLYGAALLFGMATYWVLFRTPLPQLHQESLGETHETSYFARLAVPLRDVTYRRFLVFNVLWTLVAMTPGPYYNVFMIDYLHLHYSLIAVFSSLQMVVMGLGFLLWGAVVHRFGSRPIIELLFLPTAAMPALWAFASPSFYWTVPVAMVLGGLMWSGISIANSVMLYSIIPQTGDKSAYFAVWSASLGLVNAIAPAIGSGVMRLLADVRAEMWGHSFTGYHFLFMFVTAAAFLPAAFVKTLPVLGAQRPGYVISQLMRGNPFSLAYNFFLLGRTSQPTRRAALLRSLGRTRSPLAVAQLVAYLDDPSPEVRRSAALALGDTGQPEAAEVLLAHLADAESDIRPEAARALGKLRDRRAVPALIDVLNGESDPELRIAAAEALGEIPDPAAREALVARLHGPFERAVFPSLAEALSKPMGKEGIGDLRMVRPTVAHLSHFRSRAIRMQLLGAIARCLGIGGRYVRLLNEDPYERDARLQELLTRTRRAIFALPWPEGTSLLVVTTFEQMALAQAEERYEAFFEQAAALAGLLQEHFPPKNERECALRDAEYEALTGLKQSGQLAQMEEQGVAFAVLVLHQLASQVLAQYRGHA